MNFLQAGEYFFSTLPCLILHLPHQKVEILQKTKLVCCNVTKHKIIIRRFVGIKLFVFFAIFDIALIYLTFIHLRYEWQIKCSECEFKMIYGLLINIE